MPPIPSPAGAIAPWHDFYALIGAAAATLIGLLFVAASVGAGVFAAGKRPALRVFLSPSVVHFSSVLGASLVALAPIHSWTALGILTGILGVFGVAYSALVWRSMVRQGLTASIDLDDRLCYALLPAITYAALAAAAVLLFDGTTAGMTVLAAATGALLFLGIRNAWDMTTWAITRRRD